MVDLLAPARAAVHGSILRAGVSEGHAADSGSAASEASPDALGVCTEETRSVEIADQQHDRAMTSLVLLQAYGLPFGFSIHTVPDQS